MMFEELKIQSHQIEISIKNLRQQLTLAVAENYNYQQTKDSILELINKKLCELNIIETFCNDILISQNEFIDLTENLEIENKKIKQDIKNISAIIDFNTNHINNVDNKIDVTNNMNNIAEEEEVDNNSF